MQIDIYTTTSCNLCTAAKGFLTSKGFEYTEHNIDDPADRISFKDANPDLTTVPQVFINSVHIGGFNDLIRYPLS